MKLSEKKITLSLPSSMYEQVSSLAKINYKSITGFIRDCVLKEIREETEETLTKKELELLNASIKEFKQQKGTNWRDVLK